MSHGVHFDVNHSGLSRIASSLLVQALSAMQHQLSAAAGQMHSQTCVKTARHLCYTPRHRVKGGHLFAWGVTLVARGQLDYHDDNPKGVHAGTSSRLRSTLIMRAANQNGNSAQAVIANLVSHVVRR